MNEERRREAATLKHLYKNFKEQKRKITQAEIADDIGVTQGVVAGWMAGSTRCPDRHLMTLSEILLFDPEMVRPGVKERIESGLADFEEREALLNIISGLDPLKRKQVHDFVKFLSQSRPGK